MSETGFKPSRPVRDHSVYVSWQVHKALGYLARASTDASTSTRDGLVEHVLTQWLHKNHPNVMTWIEKRQSEEKEFQKSLQP